MACQTCKFEVDEAFNDWCDNCGEMTCTDCIDGGWCWGCIDKEKPQPKPGADE